jgi:hypothetical protein
MAGVMIWMSALYRKHDRLYLYIEKKMIFNAWGNDSNVLSKEHCLQEQLIACKAVIYGDTNVYYDSWGWTLVNVKHMNHQGYKLDGQSCTHENITS